MKIAENIIQSLEDRLLNSAKSITELGLVKKEIVRELTGQIIKNTSFSDAIKNQELNSEIKKLQNYKTEISNDAEKLHDINTVRYSILNKRRMPRAEKVLGIDKKNDEPMMELLHQYSICTDVIAENMKIKEDIDSCIKDTKDTLQKTYSCLDEWAELTEGEELKAGLTRGDYKLKQEDFENMLNTDYSQLRLFIKQTAKQSIKLDKEYKQILLSKPEFRHVISAIEEKMMIGEHILKMAEINKMFEEYYLKSKDNAHEDDLLDEINVDKLADVKSTDYQYKLLKFYKGFVFYNKETKLKDMRNDIFKKINEEYYQSINQIALECKEKLKSNDFFCNINNYISEFGVQQWMKPVINASKYEIMEAIK